MRRSLIVLACLLAALAVSCRAEVNLGLNVEEDGSGTLLFEVGTDEEFREFMASFGADPNELFGELEGTIGADDEATIVDRDEAGMHFEGVEVPFDDIEELVDQVGGIAGDFGAFDSFSFVIDGSTAVFDATVSSGEALDPVADFGVDPSLVGGDAVSVNFILRMPGTVTTTNADATLPDGRLMWELPLLGGTVMFHAASDLGGSSFPWLWLVVGLILLVGLIVVVAVVVTGRRQQRQAVVEAAAAHAQRGGESPPGED